MGLVPCRDCGRSRSPKARTCPHCGRPVTPFDDLAALPPAERRNAVVMAVLMTGASLVAIYFLVTRVLGLRMW